MIIHNYESSSGKDLIREYINSLTKEEQVDGFRVLELLEKGEMQKINYKRWHKKIYEVYFLKHNRIFYIVADKNNIYVLHACRKQKNKTETKDCEIIIKRAKELRKELGKKLFKIKNKF